MSATTPPTLPTPPTPPTPPAPPTPGLPTPSPRRLFVVAVLAAVITFIITLSFGYADHAPQPHGVKLAVAAPAAVVHDLSAGLERAEPGGFVVVQVPSESAVSASVRSQSAAGGLAVPTSGPVTIVTAAATGISQQQAITAALTAAATAMHRQARAVDVVPLPAGDRAGLSAFVFNLGLLIPSLIGSVLLLLVGRRHRIWWRASAAGLFAALAGVLSTLVLDTILGALTGAGLSLIGVGVFGALSFVLAVTALQGLLGLPGTGLGALLIIFFGNAVSGGTVPLGFLPDGFRQIANWMPNTAVVRSVRDVVYFNGNDMGHAMLVLSLWVGVSLIVLLGVDRLHMRERSRTPGRAAQIHATPGVRLLGGGGKAHLDIQAPA